MPAVSKRLAVSLPDDLAAALRLMAAELGTSSGLLVRAFVRHGVEHPDDRELLDVVEDEMAAESRRRADAGRAGMASRYGRTSHQEE